jgi:hypothetical protein
MKSELVEGIVPKIGQPPQRLPQGIVCRGNGLVAALSSTISADNDVDRLSTVTHSGAINAAFLRLPIY